MKIILFANTPWYLFNYCFPLADAIRQGGADILLVSPPGEHAERLKASGFTHIPFAIHRRSLNPWREVGTVLRLMRLYRREKPDIVHHFTTKCNIYGSLAAHASGVPHIVNSVTGMGYAFSGEHLTRRFLRWIVLRLYRQALGNTRVIFQNPHDRDEFILARLVKPDQAVLIRSSGVNLEKYTLTPEPAGTPLIVLAGRMLYDKGVKEFVQAASILKERGIAARFALVGEPDEQNRTSIPAQTLKSWHNQGLIEWWGWQEDMAAVYQQAHIVCLPSYREGVPKTLIEAAATGRAIITTDTHGCREVVEHGRNGLLVPVGSVNELADALQTLILDEKLRQRMGQEGRRIAEDEFGLKAVLKAILAVYGTKGQ